MSLALLVCDDCGKEIAFIADLLPYRPGFCIPCAVKRGV